MDQHFPGILKDASVDQLEFVSEILQNHSGRLERRTGYRLVSVAGVPIPEAIRLAYVVGQTPNSEPFFYVVAWPGVVGDEPRVFDVESLAAAKSAILTELTVRLQNIG